MTTTETELVPASDLVVAPFPGVTPADPEAKARIAGAAEAMTIPFGVIDMGADNVRDALNTDIAGLAASIRRLGLVQAIGVEPSPREGRWLVNDGNRRFLALAALGLNGDDPVPVTPLTAGESAVTRVLRMLAGNLHREDLSPLDEARVVARLASVYEMTHDDIAEAMGGWNRKTVALRLALLELPADAQEAVHGGEWGVEGAQEVGRLIRDGAPPSIVEPLIAGAANHAKAMAEWARWRSMKAVAAMTEALEARGFAVVNSFAHVPTRTGYEAQAKATLELNKPADCKGVDPAKVQTVQEPNGKKRPILVVQRGLEGVAVWTVANVKRATPPATPEGPADWQVKRFAAETMVETRLRRAEAIAHSAAADMSNTAALRLAASIALGQFPVARVERLARVVGLPAELDDNEELPYIQRLRWPETVQAWLTEASTLAKLKALIWAVTLVEGAVLIGEEDGVDFESPAPDGEPAPAPVRLPHVAEAMAAGLGNPLPPAEWDGIVSQARSKMQAG